MFKEFTKDRSIANRLSVIMNKFDDLNQATIAAHAAGAIDVASGGIVPPIQTSTTYVRDREYQLLNPDNVYARDNSDVVRTAESVINNLENAQDTLLFPSGMAAIAAVMRTIKNGGTLLFQSGIYWGTTKWIREFCIRRDIKSVEMDCSNAQALDEAIIKHKPEIVFVETPSNPWLKIVDIAAASKTCTQVGSRLVVDSTAATPILSQPLNLGADIVMHSATKAINGHSDVLAGTLSVSDKSLTLWQNIITDRHDAGAIIGNFEAWLLIRGIRTLPLRVERMCDNTLLVAKYLDAHEKVETVFYPGLPAHTGHQVAVKQMTGGFGHLLSFTVFGNRKNALDFCGALNLIHRATSLGGVESVVEHRQTIEGDETGIPETLLRLSIGIEHIDDLISDIAQALDAIG
jgi:cystathionine gamma-synthase